MQLNLDFKMPAFFSNLKKRLFDPRELDGSTDLYADIVIDPRSGESKIEAHNGDGQNCLELTQAIEQAVGGVESRKLKPEANRVKRDPRPQMRNTGRNTQRLG